MPSTGVWRSVSEKRVTSVFRVVRISELGTLVVITSLRYVSPKRRL
jgi:hypothetical protein